MWRAQPGSPPMTLTRLPGRMPARVVTGLGHRRPRLKGVIESSCEALFQARLPAICWRRARPVTYEGNHMNQELRTIATVISATLAALFARHALNQAEAMVIKRPASITVPLSDERLPIVPFEHF